MPATASISTSNSGSTRALTWTSALAGRVTEVLLAHLVHCGPVVDPGEEDGDLEDVSEVRSGRPKRPAEVFVRQLSLTGHIARRRHLPISRDRHAAGHEHQIPQRTASV